MGDNRDHSQRRQSFACIVTMNPCVNHDKRTYTL